MILFWNIVALLVQCCLSLPLESFYPFGVDESDLTVSPTAGFASFNLSEDFIFYKEARRILYVSTFVLALVLLATCMQNVYILCKS